MSRQTARVDIFAEIGTYRMVVESSDLWLLSWIWRIASPTQEMESVDDVVILTAAIDEPISQEMSYALPEILAKMAELDEGEFSSISCDGGVSMIVRVDPAWIDVEEIELIRKRVLAACVG